jgi:2,6-dihydroxypseudooxynicotine hydrolase
MHILSLDGPGQGECNLAGVKLTADNYERAVVAVLDYLETRPEVDPEAIVLLGLSFGSFWAVRAAVDPRVQALAAPWASICHKRSLMEYETPRFKMLFAYLTQAPSEEALDAITDAMTSDEAMAAITCPTLLTVGEYDPRSPLPEVISLYEGMRCERELWVFDDQHHFNTVSGHVAGGISMTWNKDIYLMSLDWLADRLAGAPVRRPGQVVYVPTGAGGPYGDTVRVERTWLDALPADAPRGAPPAEVSIGSGQPSPTS